MNFSRLLLVTAVLICTLAFTRAVVSDAEDARKPGPIMLWGGGFESKTDWKDFLATCPKGPVVVVTDASSDREKTFSSYKNLFDELSKREALQWSLVDSPPVDLKHAGAIFLCGGKQMRLVTALGKREESGDEIREAHRAGVGIIATSAGAMFLCSSCITGREVNGEWEVVEGLSVFDGICETHFFREDRAKRLRDCAKATGAKRGFGIPAGNGVVINADGETEVHFSAYRLMLQ
ncbi:MAG: Type 1 glutamine amidotransferase-like domain-containing protein [Planctomycetota bacterium]|nr:Type 1 glutamine amidotransferase-like domain-containing protein [Planctomycetota bacterium]